jgi:hypothetical protein
LDLLQTSFQLVDLGLHNFLVCFDEACDVNPSAGGFLLNRGIDFLGL